MSQQSYHMFALITPSSSGYKTWKMNQGDDKFIDLFHNNSLRRFLKIRWQVYIKMVEKEMEVMGLWSWSEVWSLAVDRA